MCYGLDPTWLHGSHGGFILARCLLRRGCIGYLAHIVDTRSSEVRLEGVPVVRDFRDVFPEDLPGLPPE